MPTLDDPTVFFDDPAVFFDEVPVAPKGIKMAKVITGASRMPLAVLWPTTANVIVKMTGNAGFTTPNPPLATLQTLLTDSQSKSALYDTAVTNASQALAVRDLARQALANALDSEGAYVQNQSGGDEVQILSTGFTVRAHGTPVGPMAQVQNLSVTEGDGPGMVDAHWDPTAGASSSEVASCPGPDPAAGVYTSAALVTASSTTLTGLTSGTRVWIKVRAIGSQGPGPWSDPATKIVP